VDIFSVCVDIIALLKIIQSHSNIVIYYGWYHSVLFIVCLTCIP